MSTEQTQSTQYKSTGNLRETAKGRWREIFSVLAPELEEADGAFESRQMHVPCPGHGGTDGFRLYKDVNETGGGVCNTCGAMADGFRMLGWILAVRENEGTPKGYDPKEFNDYTRHAYSEVAYYLEHGVAKNPELRDRVARVYKAETEEERALKEEQDKLRREKIMKMGERMWKNSVPFDPMVTKYFEGRGAPDTQISPLMRFTAQTPYITDTGVLYMPAIVMPVTRMDGDTLKVVALHRIYLKQHEDGSVTKAPVKDAKKIMPWGELEGAVIRLYKLEGTTLVLAEGPETAAAVYTLTGLPCWSGVTAWGVRMAQIPNEVETVIIAEDFDISETGQKTAKEKAEAVRAMGKTAIIMSPAAFYEPGNPKHKKGVDWDDAIKADRARAEAMWAPFSLVMTPDEDELSLPGAYRK